MAFFLTNAARAARARIAAAARAAAERAAALRRAQQAAARAAQVRAGERVARIARAGQGPVAANIRNQIGRVQQLAANAARNLRQNRTIRRATSNVTSTTNRLAGNLSRVSRTTLATAGAATGAVAGAFAGFNPVNSFDELDKRLKSFKESDNVLARAAGNITEDVLTLIPGVGSGLADERAGDFQEEIDLENELLKRGIESGRQFYITDTPAGGKNLVLLDPSDTYAFTDGTDDGSLDPNTPDGGGGGGGTTDITNLGNISGDNADEAFERLKDAFTGALATTFGEPDPKTGEVPTTADQTKAAGKVLLISGAVLGGGYLTYKGVRKAYRKVRKKGSKRRRRF